MPESENPTGGCLSSKINACRRQGTSPEFPRSRFFFPRGTLSSSTSARAVTNPLRSRILLSRPFSLSFFLPLVRSLLRISGYTNTVGHAHPRFNPIRSRSRSRYGSSSLSHFPLLLSPFRSPSPLPSEDTANSPGANKLYYFYRAFHLERT